MYVKLKEQKKKKQSGEGLTWSQKLQVQKQTAQKKKF